MSNSNKAKTYVNACKNYLIKRYGAIQPEWQMMIDCLEDTLITYLNVHQAIIENGVFDPVTYRKSPLLSTEKDLLATLFKITQKLGVTPYDSVKIKKVEEDDSNLLGALMGIEED